MPRGEGPTMIDHQVIDLGSQTPYDVDLVRTTSVSVVSSDELGKRATSHGAVERLGVHAVVVPTSGRAVFQIDFEQYRPTPEMVLHIQPGQVVRWPETPDSFADVVLVQPSECPPDLFRRSAPRVAFEVGPMAEAVSAVTADLVRRRCGQEEAGALTVAAGRYLLQLIASVGGAKRSGTTQDRVLNAFHDELERSYSATRAVSYYAGSIGTSAKTLSRVTSGLTGSSPKELIDRRVTLEARRLLAHTSYSSSAIGTMLGFSEPTNFTKFFVRHTGVSPQEFRVTVE